METCYFSNQQEVDDQRYVPCDHNAVAEGKHTVCCESGDSCLTNGLCLSQSNQSDYNWRIACTDKTFEDPACLKYCTSEDDQTSDTYVVWKCPEPRKWCCGQAGKNTTCCDTDLVFEADEPVVYTTAAPIAQTSSSDPSFTSDNANSTESPLNSTSFGIGLGIGLGVAVAAIMTTVFMLWKGKHSHKRAAEGHTQSVPKKNEYEQVYEVHGDVHAVEVEGDRGLVEMYSKQQSDPVELEGAGL
ncbi:hypothetical protein EJ04DRAFT_556570 [Polyplosphaeria fusca]|uniref:Uncharacterized protein n=1 Tax=Polyplosphaeria fusca TaxID=682080 RepID=A0A9P4UY04_9PLEO|nr:hypothetical protein EJ04DRAFT_556570 [Polyplosphaeria fusca]